MLKIMIVDEYKIVNHSGGIEKVICNFANAFVKKGYDINIVGLDTEEGKPQFFLDKRVEFINLAFKGEKYENIKLFMCKIMKEVLRTFAGKDMQLFGKKVKDPKYDYFKTQFIKRLQKVVCEKKPDLILSVSPDSARFVNEASPNIKHIMMCHSDARRVIREMMDNDNDVSIFKKVDAVQVLMPSYVEPIIGVGAKNVKYIPNYVNQISKDICQDMVKKNKKIVTVGRVEKTLKRTHLLVEAFCKINHKIENWELFVYGNIDSKNYYRQIKKIIDFYRCQNKIHFMGTTNKIIDEIKDADIFVLPSASEGFSLALTEAMSLGLPVIGYKSCGMVNEIIKNNINGLLCEDGVDALGKAIIKLAENDKLRKEFGGRGMLDMKAYAPDKIWEQWEVFLKETLK